MPKDRSFAYFYCKGLCLLNPFIPRGIKFASIGLCIYDTLKNYFKIKNKNS